MAPLSGIDTARLVADVQAAVGPQRWRIWFDGATEFRLAEDRLTVGVANLFIGDYIRSHFAGHLAAALRRQAGCDVPVAYHVQPDLFVKRRAENLAQEEEAADRLAARPPAPQPAPAAPARRPAGEYRPIFTFENFVVGPCNQMACAAALSAARAPGREFHPLFIHGACGLGKTHLLHAILHALGREGRLRAALLSAEQFTNRYLEGVRTGRLDAFRHRYRTLDVLAIDDVHFLANKPATQEEFLHTFDHFDGPGRLVILASDAPPRQIEAIRGPLTSRWVAGLVVRLAAPDADTRRRILAAKAAQLGRPQSDQVLALIANQVEGSVRDLEGALTRIVAYAALLKTPVTPDLARQVLAELAVPVPPRAALQDIQAAVAEFFGVTVADVHSARKSRLVSLARQTSMVLARELTDLSYAEIARLMGGKNHTTVLAACTKWHRLVKAGAQVAWTDRTDQRAMTAEALLALLKDRLRR